MSELIPHHYPTSLYGLLLIASLRCFGARADCTRIFGLLLRHRFDAGP
jgi:hypothetical protein